MEHETRRRDQRKRISELRENLHDGRVHFSEPYGNHDALHFLKRQKRLELGESLIGDASRSANKSARNEIVSDTQTNWSGESVSLCVSRERELLS